MHRFVMISWLLLCLSSLNVFAQHAVDPAQRYHRLICLVHLTGSGKKGDEVKAEYVPTDVTSRAGIIAWSMQIADDGKMAIIHLVAVDRNALAPILADKRAEIRVFEIGKDTQQEIEKELRKYKADFSLDALKVVAR
jgi:hypothetical protein